MRRPSNLNNIRYYIQDGLGHTRALLDNASNVTDWYVYDAWGGLNNSLSSTPTANPFRWNGAYGYEWIPITGLYHVGAREYDPRVGRWLQRDPIEVASGDPNLYRYCLNDPINLVDPTGEDIVIVQQDPGAAGQGAHLRLYITDPCGDTGTWYGFYPHQPGREPSSKKKRKNGPGWIEVKDDPDEKEWKKGKRVAIDVTPQEAQKIRDKIESDKKNPPDYSLEKYNCSTWAADTLRSVAPDIPEHVRTPDQLVDHLEGQGQRVIDPELIGIDPESPPLKSGESLRARWKGRLKRR